MITLTQKAEKLASDLLTPISLFKREVGDRGAGVLLESAEVGGRWGRWSVCASGALMKLSASGGFLSVETADPALMPLKGYSGLPFLTGLKKVLGELEILPDPSSRALPPITRAVYGYLGYGAASLIEDRLKPLMPPGDAEAAFILPSELFLFDHAYARLHKLSLAGPRLPERVSPSEPKGPWGVRVTPSREEFMEAVSEAKRLISEGELIQLVLSCAFEDAFAGDPFEVYRALRTINPSPYMFHLQLPEIALSVSSPEVLVTSDGGRLRLCPIAGTRPRGRDEGEDDLFEAELAANEKEKAEHVMLVDLGRNDLGRVAKPGTVEVERFMDVERFSHVMHLTSQIRAELKDGLDEVDVVASSFPAGTVSGAPKIRAMELIARMEPLPRGPYAGGVGWFGLDKGRVDLDFGITFRGAWIRGGRAAWRAGAGLVYDSDPESEWKECLAKAEAVREALEAAGAAAGGARANGAAAGGQPLDARG
ncbi:MAG: anthranilate synthase component I family protein [Deltaproteobacteria bacterium]|jgi:anthranilate synthase component 1|nr:anthranilate synthase component I family protein [Deltaproteobacteria bacterium]